MRGIIAGFAALALMLALAACALGAMQPEPTVYQPEPKPIVYDRTE